MKLNRQTVCDVTRYGEMRTSGECVCEGEGCTAVDEKQCAVERQVNDNVKWVK